MRFFILSTILLLLSFSTGMASDKENFKEETWEELVDGIDYSDKINERKEERKKESKTEPNLRLPSSGTNFGGLGYIFVIVVAGGLILLVIFMIANSTSNPTLAAQNVEIQNIEKIEEHIHEVDLNDLFSRFVSTNDYNMAIRISFLMIIKSMTQQKLIKWEKQKTNWEYYDELTEFELRAGFGPMIQSFERVWYGEKVITEPEFIRIEEKFNGFKERLGG